MSEEEIEDIITREREEVLFLRYYQAYSLYFKNGANFKIGADGAPVIKVNPAPHLLKVSRKIITKIKRKDYRDFCIYNNVYELGNVPYVVNAGNDIDAMSIIMKRGQAEYQQRFMNLKNAVDDMLAGTALRGDDLLHSKGGELPVVAQRLLSNEINTVTFMLLDGAYGILDDIEQTGASGFAWGPVHDTISRMAKLFPTESANVMKIADRFFDG